MEDEDFCFSSLEDSQHQNRASPPFVEDLAFTDLFQQLDAYVDVIAVTEDDGVKPLVVVGESGVGKSSALANWAARRKSNAPPTRRLDYEEYVFWHTVGCSRLSTHVTHLLRRLVNGLILHFDLKESVDLADEKLSWVLPRLLERASKKGRVTIVIDGGLQHIAQSDKDYGLKWLPLRLPQNVRMILSATTPNVDSGNAQDTTDFTKKLLSKVQQTWGEVQRRKWPTLPLECLQISRVPDFIEKYSSLMSNECPHVEKLLDERNDLVEIISANKCATNALFLTLMLRGLCHAISSGYNTDHCLVAWMPCRTTEELVEHMLSLFESGMPRKRTSSVGNSNRLGPLLGDALSLLFVARHGLREHELFELLGRVKERSKWKTETQGTVVPVKLKLLDLLTQSKNRLIDIFRSFDTDGNGTLSHEEFYVRSCLVFLKCLLQVLTRSDFQPRESHDEVTQLINDVDSNGDGEIDYQETLDHFEHLARSYSHGKRRGSVFLRTKTEIPDLCLSEAKRFGLLRTLRCIGVSFLDARNGSVLTLPRDNTALRDVIWKKYINASGESNEAKFRSFVIEYFSKKQPSLRCCEELPWHLKKVKDWSDLKKILVDLRTLDIMYSKSALKAELFNYLRILTLTGKVKFDVVTAYNRSMEKWCQSHKPSANQVSRMSHFIADVMAWFSRSISDLTKLPPFLRDNLEENHLLQSLGIDLPLGRENGALTATKARTPKRRDQAIQSESQYFFQRWIWIQFPWLALKNASMACQENAHPSNEKESHNHPPESTTRTERSPSLRDRARINARISEPSPTLMKLDKLDRMETKFRTPTKIPFSSGTAWENKHANDVRDMDPSSSYDKDVKQLRELQHIYDSLTVEADSKAKHLKELEDQYRSNQVGVAISHRRISDGEKSLRELQLRLEQINGLIDTASNVDLVYQNILLALHDTDPTTQNYHIKLEQQIRLSRQQIADLQQEKDAMTKEAEDADARSKEVVSRVKSISQERQRIKPVLESLQQRLIEENERKKVARVTSFDPAAFSRRVRLEGRIARRRETKLKRSRLLGACTKSSAEINKAAELHAMERLAQSVGSRDPESIAGLLDDDETERLRVRQEKCELLIKEQSETLASLQSQISGVRLADCGSDIQLHEISGKDVLNIETSLTSKENKLESLSQLVKSISLTILNLDDMVQPTERDRRISEFTHITLEAAKNQNTRPNSSYKQSKKEHDVQKLAQLIKSLCNEIPSDVKPLAKKPKKSDEIEYQNVRVLNRDELEATFSKVTKQLQELEDADDNDSEQDNDDDFGKLASYVDHGVSSNESQNEQRRANLLMQAKQGKYACKGMVLEAVLQSAQAVVED